MSKLITASELKKHNHRKSVWIVLKNDVYDVTSYLNEHPGGEDPLLDAAGMDATRAFEDVGHSADARSLLKKYKIGSLAQGESCCKLTDKPRKWMSSTSSPSHRCLADEKKPWRNFDKPKQRSTPKHSKTSIRRSRSKSPPSKSRSRTSSLKKCSKSTSTQKVEVEVPASNTSTPAPTIVPRVPSIVVPRRRRPRCFPCAEERRGVRKPSRHPPQPSGGGKWKWALLALAAAIIVGVAYKKYAS